MTKPNLRNLLSFYLECLEEEDLRSLNFNVAQIDKSFVLGGNGSFVLSSRTCDLSEIGSYFWKRNEAVIGDQERVFLGFPILLHKNTVTPLFFLEMNVKSTDDNHLTLIVADSFCYLNHHLFGNQAYDIQGSLELQNEFECDLLALDVNLSKALEFLGAQLETDILERQESINYNGTQPRWVNNFILFRGGRSAVNAMLRRDITTFLKYPKFIENVCGTALEALLAQDLSKKTIIDKKPKFSHLNDEQKQARDAGLSQKLTVITGPPGTGKSQVVVNVLATCALEKKSVLFASKNNKAVDVVFDKLQTILKENNWVLRLGNHEKLEECKNRIINQLSSSPEEIIPLLQLNEGLLDVEHRLEQSICQISQLERQQGLLAEYEANIRSIRSILDPAWEQQAIDKNSWGEQDAKIQADIEEYFQQLESLSNQNYRYIWLKIISFFFAKKLKKHYCDKIKTIAPAYMNDITELKLLLSQDNSFSTLRDIYGKFSAVLKLQCLTFEKSRIEKALLQMPTSRELKEQIRVEKEKEIELYCEKLKSSWGMQVIEKRSRLFALFRRYFNTINKPPKNFAGWNQFSNDFKSLIDDFYIWIVTNLSARKCMPLEGGVFDVVVIDEASQCDILSALPLLYRAKSAIIIGDPNQLRHITSLNAGKEEEIAKKHHVENLLADWSYRNKSIYDLAEAKLLESSDQPHLLSHHYRCHPEIIGFSNNALYKGKLLAKTDLKYLKDKFKTSELGVFWHDVNGTVPHSSSSAYNQAEVDQIIKLIGDWRLSLEVQGISIGIVTPFRRQVERIKAAIDKKKSLWGESFISSIVIGTAHRFQGDECDLIIFSPVVALGMKPHLAKWVASSAELLNVAITRARGAFHVVGDAASCIKAGFLLEELANYIHHCRAGKASHFNYESPAEEIVGEILSSLDLPFFVQVEKGPYRLDFVVVTPFGNKVNLEIDGRQHYASDHVMKDEIRDRYISDLGYRVVRVDARDVFLRREFLVGRLLQIV